MWYFTVPPKVIFGEDALDGLSEELESAKKLFIVTDKVVKSLGFLDKVLKKIETKIVQIFDEVEPESSIETLRKGGELCTLFKPDWIIALGGGSVIDTAKGIWFIYERPDLDLLDDFDPLEKLGLGNKSKLAAVPTTSGTGSDCTWASIVHYKAENRKITFASRDIIPTISILDPIFPVKMPQKLTVSTAMDALTHAVEAFISTWSNDFSDALALHALKLIFQNLPKIIEDNEDLLVREKLHNAATMAGMSFSNSQVGIAHSMAHALGGLFRVPHGTAVSIALIYSLEFSVVEAKDRLAELNAVLRYKKAGNIIEAIKQLMKDVDAPLRYEEVIPNKEEYLKALPRLVELANGETGTVMSPRIPTYEEFEKLYLYAYEGKKIDF